MAGSSRAGSASDAAPRIEAVAVLIEVLGYYKHQATDFEAMMWKRIIDDHGDDAVIKFLHSHVTRSSFAPKVSEALAMLRPGANNAQAAFMALTNAVERCGPYRSPSFEDPAVAQAVVMMGGWVAVNEQLPSAQSRFDYEAFFTRFESAYQMAAARAIQLESVPNHSPRSESRVGLRNLHDISRDRQNLLALAGAGASSDVASAHDAPLPAVAARRLSATP